MRDLRGAVLDFCSREFADPVLVSRWTDGGREMHSAEAARLLAAEGWLGLGIPVEYGGSGGTVGDLSTFLEAAWYAQAPVGAYATSAIVAAWYLRFGSEPQKRDVLAGVATGRVEALALSEPGAGSDLGGVTTSAVALTDGYVLAGTKTWCSNAHLADHLLVLARTDERAGRAGLSMFSVRADAPGVRIRPLESLAGSELNEVTLDDVELPPSALVGAPGQAWLQVMAGLVFERLVIASTMLGLARRTLADTVEHVRRREQFGRPIAGFQAIRHRLADLATEVECCGTFVADAVSRAETRSLTPHRASMVKLKVTETARRVALEGTQMTGAAGFAADGGSERQLRRSLLATVYGGTSEIQRDIVADALL